MRFTTGLEKYVKRGWYIFPITKNAKTPLVKWDWRDVSTNDMLKIATWFRRFPGCNWAVDCEKSGLTVLDIGSRKLIPFAMDRVLLVTLTPTEGKHIYKKRIKEDASGLRYALLPGSFIDGRGYEVLYDKDALPTEGELSDKTASLHAYDGLLSAMREEMQTGLSSSNFPRVNGALKDFFAPPKEDHKYAKLTGVFNAALEQASKGKGAERHANGKAFDDQPICVISQLLEKAPGKTAGPAFQAVKKIIEAGGMSSKGKKDAAIHELYGAINYVAAMIILLSED